jgi:hypothetical protein
LGEKDDMPARWRKMTYHGGAPLAKGDGVAYMLDGEEASLDREV